MNWIVGGGGDGMRKKFSHQEEFCKGLKHLGFR